MTMASTAGATPIHRGLPEEIIIWEILVRLPPKPLLRCRAVCHAWRRATSARHFLQIHHARQPSLPLIYGSGYLYGNFFVFDHRAATGTRLQPIARLGDSFCVEASCDGLLVLSGCGRNPAGFSVCNPITRQHAPLRQLSGFRLLAMYAHRPTGEYRLLLHRILGDQIGWYTFALGSDQPPRYIEGLEVAVSTYLPKPALVRDSLHWYPLHYNYSDLQQHRTGSEVVIVFDTTSETFRQMRAPLVPIKSYIFKMDGTLGIYSYDDANAMQTVDIWMLKNYENEVWEYKYKVRLPVVEIKRHLGRFSDHWWYVSVEAVDDDVLLLVSHGGCMFYVDIDGQLVDFFHRVGQNVYACKFGLKQTLVPHTFFAAVEGYAVNASPFIGWLRELVLFN